ncbi:CGNR zinc finger domain-containing protein [Novosphingobium terrae]|uniref:CGNR zinc finger domain-containing protein n=1 Tax=Novosphingobium terrae TaxID=2726189 RepID=UPI00197D9B54|nr:CGNR zinc finger domain-containing protein [Novosphingobium terrae]
MIDTRAIRFGGQETPGGFQFELSGGAVALDFANTLDERPRGGLERIADYPALALWSVQSGFLTEGERATLLAAAQQAPAAAAAVHAQALGLRELIFATVKATIASDALSHEQVHCWNDWLQRVQASRCLSWGGSGLACQQADVGAALDGILLHVADAAIQLFLDPDARSRLRLCASDDCDWAFLDRSRRQNRVWCDMTVCGNRAKAARHYRRKVGISAS